MCPAVVLHLSQGLASGRLKYTISRWFTVTVLSFLPITLILLFVTISLRSLFCGFSVHSQPTLSLKRTEVSEWNPHETFVVLVSFCPLCPSLFLHSSPPLAPPHRDEAQSRRQMWELEWGCEAGVCEPRVLADEILVCSEQQQGHFHCCSITLSHHLTVASPIASYFLFGQIVSYKKKWTVWWKI